MNKLLKLIGFERKGYRSETYHFKWGEVSWHPKKWGLGLKVCNWGCESRNLLMIEPLFCSIYINLSKEYDRDERYDIVDRIQVSYPYKYHLKNGSIQEREAKVHVTNMVWTRKWFPLLLERWLYKLWI